jgi:ATP-binding cassette subfamily B (MDR/TAP) protein 1
VAFRYSWALTLVSSSTILFVLIVYSITTPILIKSQHTVDKANEEASSIAGEVFGSIRTIVACGAESRLADRYAVFALSFWFGVRLYSRGSIANSGTVVTLATPCSS